MQEPGTQGRHEEQHEEGRTQRLLRQARAGAARAGAQAAAVARALGLDTAARGVMRWYGEHRLARQWTVNIVGALLLIKFAQVASNWIQPTLTPDMLFPSATIGPEAVRVTEAKPGSVRRVATYTGSVLPWQDNVVYARVDGYVQGLSVYPGDYVRRGQVLARLETSRLEPQLQEAVADSAFRTEEYRRDSLLFADSALSATAFDLSRARHQQAAAKVALLRTQIGYASIRALADGWVAQRFVYPGQYVKPGEPVVKVDDLRRVRMQFAMAEEHLSQIRPGSDVYLRFPQLDQEQVVAAWPERALPPGGLMEPVPAEELRGSPAGASGLAGGATQDPAAQRSLAMAATRSARDAPPPSGNRAANQSVAVAANVAVVFPAQDPATRTGIVEVRLPNPQLVLRTNTYVVGDFIVAHGARGVRVPVSALTPMPGGRTVVFVVPPVVEQGTAEEREVVVGVRNSEFAEILSGVAPGERVVYQGNRGLVNRQPVMVLNPGGGL